MRKIDNISPDIARWVIYHKWIIHHVPLHLVVADEPYIVESRSVTGSVESGYTVGYIWLIYITCNTFFFAIYGLHCRSWDVKVKRENCQEIQN